MCTVGQFVKAKPVVPARPSVPPCSAAAALVSRVDAHTAVPGQQQLWMSQGPVLGCISALTAEVSDSCPAAERQPE